MTEEASAKRRFMRSAIGTGLLGVSHKAFGLITAILLAQVMGAEGYGYYAFAVGAISIFAVPALLGLPQLITREIAKSHALEQWASMAGLRRWALGMGIIAMFVAASLCVLLLLFSARVPAVEPHTFILAVLLLPLMISMEIVSSVLRGLRKVVHAMWPVAALKPGLLAGVLAAMVFVGVSPEPAEAMLVNVLSTAAALVVLLSLLIRHWPGEARQAIPAYKAADWLRALPPFTLLGAANIITQKTDIVMLGMLGEPADVGIYQVAVQGAMLVSFGFMALNALLSPHIARYHARAETAQLQKLMGVSSAVITLIAIAVMLVYVGLGDHLLRWVFGSEFERGHTVLLILGVGQLCNASVGSVGTFLSMSGHEHDTLKAIATAAVLNVALNALLIPVWGMVGAAVATMAATILWNGMMAVAVYRKLGLIPGPVWIIRRQQGGNGWRKREQTR